VKGDDSRSILGWSAENIGSTLAGRFPLLDNGSRILLGISPYGMCSGFSAIRSFAKPLSRELSSSL
jgi:hypothetical protein